MSTTTTDACVVHTKTSMWYEGRRHVLLSTRVGEHISLTDDQARTLIADLLEALDD